METTTNVQNIWVYPIRLKSMVVGPKLKCLYIEGVIFKGIF